MFHLSITASYYSPQGGYRHALCKSEEMKITQFLGDPVRIRLSPVTLENGGDNLNFVVL